MKTIMLILLALPLSGCIPRIEVAPPKEPVTINMNVKIDHEIHIKMDDQLKTLIEQDSDLLAPGNTSDKSASEKPAPPPAKQ